MKIYVKGKLVDTNKEPVVIMFDNDIDRKAHADNLSSMQEKDAVRIYAVAPDSLSSEALRELINQAKASNNEI